MIIKKYLSYFIKISPFILMALPISLNNDYQKLDKNKKGSNIFSNNDQSSRHIANVALESVPKHEEDFNWGELEDKLMKSFVPK